MVYLLEFISQRQDQLTLERAIDPDAPHSGTNLPDDAWTLIIRQCDMDSRFALAKTCKRLRELVRTCGARCAYAFQHGMRRP